VLTFSLEDWSSNLSKDKQCLHFTEPSISKLIFYIARQKNENMDDSSYWITSNAVGKAGAFDETERNDHCSIFSINSPTPGVNFIKQFTPYTSNLLSVPILFHKFTLI
jgi:hypothetical protein